MSCVNRTGIVMQACWHYRHTETIVTLSGASRSLCPTTRPSFRSCRGIPARSARHRRCRTSGEIRRLRCAQRLRRRLLRCAQH